MTLREFIDGISFVSCKPDDPWNTLEVKNTVLPEEIAGLDIIGQVPHMSSYATGAVINKIVTDMPADQCFVNVGVWHGYTLFAGMLNNPEKTCIGVDNFSEFAEVSMSREHFGERFKMIRTPKHLFFEADFEKYFDSFHSGTIGFYIYDAAHDYASQLKGLKAAEPFLADGAYVMVDDVNWAPPRKATLDFMAGSESNWEIVADKQTSALAHPTWWNGVMLIKKLGRKANADQG